MQRFDGRVNCTVEFCLRLLSSPGNLEQDILKWLRLALFHFGRGDPELGVWSQAPLQEFVRFLDE